MLVQASILKIWRWKNVQQNCAHKQKWSDNEMGLTTEIDSFWNEFYSNNFSFTMLLFLLYKHLIVLLL